MKYETIDFRIKRKTENKQQGKTDWAEVMKRVSQSIKYDKARLGNDCTDKTTGNHYISEIYCPICEKNCKVFITSERYSINKDKRILGVYCINCKRDFDASQELHGVNRLN